MDRFEAEEGEARVVAQVRVRQQHALHRVAVHASGGGGAEVAQRLELVPHVRRGVDEPHVSGGREQDRETRDEPPPPRIFARGGAALAGAGGVG